MLHQTSLLANAPQMSQKKMSQQQKRIPNAYVLYIHTTSSNQQMSFNVLSER